MPYEFRTERRVDFVDTDMAGIVHFSNFFRFMESAEHEFFRSLGQPLHERDGGRMTGWARVHAECDYKKPLFYQDVFEVHLLVREKRSSSLSYEVAFRRDAVEVARGVLTTVCVAREAGEAALRPVPMPPEIDERIQVAPPELLART